MNSSETGSFAPLRAGARATCGTTKVGEAGKKDWRDAAGPQQQPPVVMAEVSEGPSKQHNSQAEGRVNGAGKLAAEIGAEEVDIKSDNYRKAAAQEQTQREALQQQLGVRVHERPGIQQRTIPDHYNDEHVATAQPVCELTDGDRSDQGASTLCGVGRTCLGQGEPQSLSKEGPEHINRVPCPTVEELCEQQKAEAAQSSGEREMAQTPEAERAARMVRA